jgi:hypothetical protein
LHKEQMAKHLWITGKGHHAWCGYKDISGTTWNSIRTGAKQRGIPFTISLRAAWNLFNNQNGLCAISGEKIRFPANAKERKAGLATASLDRIDSSKGYVKGNIQWVHVTVNYMKQWLGQSEFIKWCNKIAVYNTGKKIADSSSGIHAIGQFRANRRSFGVDKKFN